MRHQKSQKSKNFLGKKSNISLGSLVKILNVLGFLVFLVGIPKFFLDFSTSLQNFSYLVKNNFKDLDKKNPQSIKIHDERSKIFLGSLVKILDVLGFLVFLAGFPKFVLFFSTILTINPTFFLVFLSISWIVLVFLFSCQEFRKFSWIVSMILQKLAYLVKNNCKDLVTKSQNSMSFLGKKTETASTGRLQ